MGSLKTPRLSEDEIVARYRAGEARGILGLRAGVPDYRLVEILNLAGWSLRTPEQARALAEASRAATVVRNRRRRKRF